MNEYKLRAMKRLFGDSSRKSDTSFKDAFYSTRVVLDNLVKEAQRVKYMLSDVNDLKKLDALIKKTHQNVLNIKDGEEPSKAREAKISKEYEKLRNSGLYKKFDLDMYV